MAEVRPLFEIEQDGKTLIATPLTDMRELEFEQIQAGAAEVLDRLNRGTVRNVILDFHKTDYYGSTALGFFVSLWTRVRTADGCMAFCNVSDNEKQILKVTKLDSLWPLCSSRQEALNAVAGNP
jgi:anti-sigma B factor antagonist